MDTVPISVKKFEFVCDGILTIITLNVTVYVENARSSSATTLQFTIVTGGTWKIKVSQIECYSTSRAYPDCDQFFTGISGTVASYNWPNVQLQNTDMNICIRREEGMIFSFFLIDSSDT